MTENKLFCPYCTKPLHCGAQLNSDSNIIELYQCANPECESTEFLVGCKEFWDILGQHKRTRKQLDVARSTIAWIQQIYEKKIEQIIYQTYNVPQPDTQTKD